VWRLGLLFPNRTHPYEHTMIPGFSRCRCPNRFPDAEHSVHPLINRQQATIGTLQALNKIDGSFTEQDLEY